MDRIWLTRSDRIDTLTRGAMAGLFAGTLLAVFEMIAAEQAGDGALLPWRMAASVVLGRDALGADAGGVIVAGVFIHLLLSVGTGIIAAALYEWSAWSLSHRASLALACFAGGAFGVLVWFVHFPLLSKGILPWLWGLHQGVQFIFHLGYGVALGVALRALGRHALNPPDSAQAM